MSFEQTLNDKNPAHKEFSKLLDDDFKDRKLIENRIVKATVIEILNSYVIVDARGKSESMIPISEFNEQEIAKLKVGSSINCFVERIESMKTGETVLSYEKAKSLAAWEKCITAHENKEELTGVITNKIKGGFICKLFSGAISSFLPTSQLCTRPLKGAAVERLMNTPIKVMIVRLDRSRGNCASSRRAVIEQSRNKETAEALKEIKENDIVETTIHNINDWAVFTTYKSIQMMVHVSDLSYSKVKKPSDLVSVGDQLKVRIIKIDKANNRVSASVKALTEDPFENIEKKFKIGEIYLGTISKVVDFGVFVSLDSNVEGLCHSSQMDWANKNVKPSKIFSVSQKAKFKLISIEKETKRISLSYKATLPNPWDEIKDKINKEVKIKINNITDKAIFGELIDSGLSGMLHFKEISWSENIEDLKKFKKNDIINVKILEIKDDKIRFSKRALDKDPLDWFRENNKKIGDVITTRIHEVLKTGVKVSIDKDKKLIVTIRKADLAKESADQRVDIFSKGNALDAKLIELDLRNRKIKLSPKAAMIDEEKSLIQKFGENATKSGATLRGIFKAAIGKKGKKEK